MSIYQNTGDDDLIEFEFEEELRQHVLNELSTSLVMPKKATNIFNRFQELRAFPEVTGVNNREGDEAIEMRHNNSSFSMRLTYEAEHSESQCLETYPDHLFRQPPPSVYYQMFQKHPQKIGALELFNRLDCRKSRPQIGRLIKVIH